MTHNLYCRKYIYLAILIISAVLSGCHPCSVIQCGNWVSSIAYTDKTGNLYIDIKNKGTYDYAELTSISISKTTSNNDSEGFWAAWGRQPAEQVIHGNYFPIQYGKQTELIDPYIPAKKITNGRYQILGFVIFYKNGEKYPTNIKGEFIYQNGSIKNINN